MDSLVTLAVFHWRIGTEFYFSHSIVVITSFKAPAKPSDTAVAFVSCKSIEEGKVIV